MNIGGPRFTGALSAALHRLREVAAALGPLGDRVVFIGGAIAPLLQTHPVAPAVRPTDDVDAVAMTTSYADFERLEDRLRAQGFRHQVSMGDAPMHAHRWMTPAGVPFDLVPIGEHMGAAGGRWDQLAIERGVLADIAVPGTPALLVRHADAVAFLLLKWVAFGDRGDGDVMASHDVEDIFAVLASRPSIADECDAVADPTVRNALGLMARTLLRPETDFGDLVAGHVALASADDARAVYLGVRDRLYAMTRLT